MRRYKNGDYGKTAFILTTILIIFTLLSCSKPNSTQKSPVIITHYEIPTNFPVPKNPVDNNKTPAWLNYAVFTRYYFNPEPQQIKAILVLMPGFYGGAGDFTKMAKTIVEMGKGDVEVWTVDRRSVLLDDLTGLKEAWNKRSPSIAYDYYFSGAAIDGKTYKGPRIPSSISYMSEWGLNMTLHDLKTIISLIPRQYRKTNVFLGGHSLGSWIAQDYAAYDFDGDPSTLSDAGYNQIAGIILLDGGGTGLFPSMTSADYLSGTSSTKITLSGLAFTIPGIDQIRKIPDYVTPAGLIGGIGPAIYKTFLFIQTEGLYAMLEPNKLSILLQNDDFKLIASILLGNTQLKATNEAMLGFTMDRHFDPIGLMTATLGIANGPLKSVQSALVAGKTLSQPTNTGTMVYTWNSENHITNIKDLAAALSNTYTTITEWYFPMRLAIDVMALSDDYNVTGTSDWRWQQGLYVIHTPQMDAPVLAFGGGSGLEQTTTVFNTYRDMLPPARDCGNQPRTECGFKVYLMPDYTHMDILLSDPTLTSDNVDAIIYNWVIDHTQGSMPAPSIPAQ